MGPSSRSSPRIVVGRYALYGEIAAGGMATVHFGRLAGPVGFTRTVAIKRLHAHFAKDPEFSAMFLDEARIAARIRHPNVVQTLDVVATDGELFVVMDYVQGESLTRLLRACAAEGRPVPLDVVSAIVCGALHGLHAAHEATAEDGKPLDIVHRDVSPQNVLVGSDGVPRVLDFGVAKATGRLQTTRDGQLKGKLAYMSPEQLRSENVDRRTDVYAAGVVLWELLTLERLFFGEVEVAVMKKVLEGSPKAPSAVASHVPPAVDEVVLRALARDPGHRFPTARSMALALEAAVPLASATRISDWVERLVGDVLAERARSVAEIESQSGVGSGGLRVVPRDTEETKTDPRNSGPILEVGGTSPGSRPPGTARSPGVAALPRRRPVPIVAAAVGAIVLTALALRLRLPHTAAPVASTIASANPVTLLDLAVPATGVPEAAHEYAAGMQTLHDNNWSAAAAHFERAARLDPRMALAHLRFAMTGAGRSREQSRAAYMRAVDLRSELSERDQGLMAAIEPVVLRSHGDPVEASRRLRALVERYPLDVEFHDLLALVRPDSPDSLVPSERAIELDPQDGQAWQTKATALWTLGRLDEANETFRKCAALSVDSADCVYWSAVTDRVLGRCAAYEADARAYSDRDPADGWPLLTAAMVGMNRPGSAVREAVDQGLARQSDADRAAARLAFDGQAALVAGDFETVLALGSKEADSIAGDAVARADFAPRYRLALRMVGAALESGDGKRAAGVARDFVARSETWARDPVPERGGDLTVYLMRLAAPGAAGPDFDAARRGWVDARLAEGHYRGTLWAPAFAAPATTPDEARAALAVMPEYAPLARSFDRESIQDAVVGRAYVLAGRAKEALPYLTRAAASCDVFYAPVAHTRAVLDLGEALEDKGDRAGACDAYAKVVARWGRARPRSVSAEKARQRRRALGCKD